MGGRKGIRPVKTQWWGAGAVVSLEQGADLHMAQLMPLPLTVSCFSKIHIGFTFLVPAHPDSPGKRAVKRVCVCVCDSFGSISLGMCHMRTLNRITIRSLAHRSDRPVIGGDLVDALVPPG